LLRAAAVVAEVVAEVAGEVAAEAGAQAAALVRPLELPRQLEPVSWCRHAQRRNCERSAQETEVSAA